MNFFYFSSKFIFFSCLLLLFIYYTLGVSFILSIGIILFLGLSFLFRKKRKLNINKDKKNGLVFSPISGVIKDITEENNKTIIHIRRSFYEEWGVYMPSSGRVQDVIDYPHERRKVLTIRSQFGHFSLCVVNKKYSSFDCWLESGDYAYTAARIGMIKGVVDILLFLPSDFSTVMYKNEIVKSGKSILAVNTVVHDE